MKTAIRSHRIPAPDVRNVETGQAVGAGDLLEAVGVDVDGRSRSHLHSELKLMDSQ